MAARTTPEQRTAAFLEMFQSFDLDGNGTVGIQELHQVMQASARVGTKEHHKVLRRFEAQVHQAAANAKASGGQPAEAYGGLVTFDGVNGEPSFDPNAFASFMTDLTHDLDNEADFQAFCTGAMSAVEDAKEQTAGNNPKKMGWTLFQTLDANGDGYVDLNELTLLLDVNSLHDKKEVAKWKVVVEQKYKSQIAEGTGVAAATGDEAVKMKLSDFQAFLEEFTGGSEARLTQIAETVQDEMSAKYDMYLRQHRVDEIFEMIRMDLCKERPDNALAGIQKSVERMKRVGFFSSTLRRKRSMAALDSTLSASRGGPPSPRDTTTDGVMGSPAGPM